MKQLFAFLGLTVSLGLAGQTAHAAAETWTVAHGGTGVVDLNSDGTFTSNCVPLPGYKYALCPSVSGRYARGTGGNAQYMYFYGNDNRTVTYRVSGTTTAPDTLTQIKNGQYYNGLIIKKGSTFICSQFYDSIYNFSRGPVGVSCNNGQICAAGSLQLLGPVSTNYVLLSETSPGYFIEGRCQ